jgi:broad specificity phosphatase PhoE
MTTTPSRSETSQTEAASDSGAGRHTAVTERLWLIRHGDTEWSLSGRHTGRTDLPLTPDGERHAADVGKLLAGRRFSLVLTSPLRRAMETCRLAGFGDAAQVDADLLEWNYGEYEGRTSAEIQSERPGWSLWRDGVVGGESLAQVAARAQAVIDRVLRSPGDALLFAHGHILRVLISSWLGLPPDAGRLFALGTAAVTTLGYEHTQPALVRFNDGMLHQR